MFWVLWNLTKFQLIQLIQTIVINIFYCLKENFVKLQKISTLSLVQEWLHFGYQKLRLPRKGSASLKTKMFLTRQIVCHLPADFLAVKKEFSWLKNCCSSLSASMSATCKSLWNFERRKNKKSGSTTPFFWWWLVSCHENFT